MSTPSSLAGTWGEGRLTALRPPAIEKQTTYTEKFGLTNIRDAKIMAQHPSAKFRQLQEDRVMICQYENKAAHSSTGRSKGELEEGSNMSVASLGSATSSKQLPATTPINESMAMIRTQSKLSRTSTAKIAVGRSGHRLEKGISASGLLGERLQPNSFIQRSWLPYDDPALLYRVNGVPEVSIPTDVSLNIGVVGDANPGVNWSHGRRGKPFPAGVFSDE